MGYPWNVCWAQGGESHTGSSKSASSAGWECEWENHPLDCGAGEEGLVICRTNNETFEERSCSKYLVYLFTGEIDVLKDMGGRFSRTKVGNSGCSGVIIVFTVNSDMFSLQLFQNLKNLMNPYRVAFESPLELSAQGNLFPEQKCTHTHTLLTSLPPSGGIFIKKQF